MNVRVDMVCAVWTRTSTNRPSEVQVREAAQVTTTLPETTDQNEPAKPRSSSRIAGFYKMSMSERLDVLLQEGVLEQADIDLLRETGIDADIPNQMIENAIGVMALPLGLGLNFIVNDKDYIVPMAVEEPSVIAAVSHVAKIVRGSGGFESAYSGSHMVGQIQVIGCPDLKPLRLRSWVLGKRFWKWPTPLSRAWFNEVAAQRTYELDSLMEAVIRRCWSCIWLSIPAMRWAPT